MTTSSAPSRNLEMRQGDDRTLRLPVTSAETLNLPLSPSAQIEWWMCSGPAPDPDNLRVRRVRGDDLVLEQEAGVWVVKVRLYEEDTVALPAGEYYHECRIDEPAQGARTIVFGIVTLRPSAIAQGLADPDMMLPPPYTSSAARRAMEAALGLQGTSTSNVTIGLGNRTFATQENKQFIPGHWIEVVDAADPTRSMGGYIVSYEDGSLVVNVAATFGAGANANWIIAVSGRRGLQGAPGFHGWAPVLANQADGARIVARVVDWTGGTGDKPATGSYIGASGLVATAAEAVDVRGLPGATGNAGWSPVLANQADGARVVARVIDWTGGAGNKPATGSFVGSSGLVATAAEAVDIRGATGSSGWSPVLANQADGARIVARVVDWTGGAGNKPATGSYIGASGLVATAAEAVDLRGQQGAQGLTGGVTPEVTALLNSATTQANNAAGSATAASQAAAGAVAVSGLGSMAAVTKILNAAANVVALAPFAAARDADFGAWREKIAHVSTAAEPLGTATRGARAQVPQNGFLVGVATVLSLHDLDDPQGPLWKSWPTAGLTSVSYLGSGLIGYGSATGFYTIDMIEDRVFRRSTAGLEVCTNQSVATYNQTTAVFALVTSSGALPSNTVNSIASVIAPLTQLERNRCDLPRPTIVLGTASGACTIRADRAAVNSAATTALTLVSVDEHLTLWAGGTGGRYRVAFPAWLSPSFALGVSTDATLTSAFAVPFANNNRVAGALAGRGGRYLLQREFVGVGGGVAFILPHPDVPASSLAAVISQYRNSGFLFGGAARRLAFCESALSTSDLVDELVINEQFADAAGWTLSSGSLSTATLAAVSGTLVFTTGTGDTAGRTFSKPISGLVVGDTYVLQTTSPISGTSSDVRLSVRPALNGLSSFEAFKAQAATTYVFVATSPTMTIQISSNGGAAGSTAIWHPFTVRRRIADATLNHNHGTVNGTLQRFAVEAGAEMAEIGGFSDANFIHVPYASGLDFASGDFVFGPVWVRDDGVNAVQTIFERAHYTGGAYSGARIQLIKDGNRFAFLVSDGTNSATANGATFSPASGRRFCVAGVRRGSHLEIWVNGVCEARVSAAGVGSLSNASAIFVIGRRHNSNATAQPFGGRIALPRVSALAPDVDQIAFAFEQERRMFAPDAKSLLLGSPVVNATGYDAEGDRVLVATAAGTNIFSGLLRTGYLLSTAPLSGSNAHTLAVANDNLTAIRTASGVDMWASAVPLRERTTGRRAMPTYDPSRALLKGFTIDATPSDLAAVAIPEGKAFFFTAHVVAMQPGASAADRAFYRIEGKVWRDIGGVVQVTSTTTTLSETTSTMDAAAAVTTATNQFHPARVSGRAGTPVSWRAAVEMVDAGLVAAA